MQALTDNEARAIAYFAIGVSSEGGDQAYVLAFAGNTTRTANGAVELHPIANSGYSIGTLQTDLGQDGGVAATQLVSAFQRWAQTGQPKWTLDDSQRRQAISDLRRNGRQIRADLGRDIDPSFKSHLQSFLASDEGIRWVHRRDLQQVDKLMSEVVEPLRASRLYQTMSATGQARLVAITAKAYNQSERWGGEILRDIVGGNYRSVEEVSAAIDQLPDYMQSGRDAALRGVDLFDSLQRASASNPMQVAWQHVLANPLVDPVMARADTAFPQLSHEYQAIKDAFADPEHGLPWVEALEHAGSYSYGDPARTRGRGFLAEGRDFVEWNRAGNGQAFVRERWLAVARADLSLTLNTDRTIDLRLGRGGASETLLRAVHSNGLLEATRNLVQNAGSLQERDRGSQVRGLQSHLAALGYCNTHGHALVSDGDFGSETRKAVEAFQRDHGLMVDGIAGRRTLAAVQQAITAREVRQLTDSAHPGHMMYCQALEGVRQLDARQGRVTDQLSVNLAASLAVAANREGLRHVDQVVLGTDRDRVFAVEGCLSSPLKRYVEVGVLPAIRTTLEQSSAQWAQADSVKCAEPEGMQPHPAQPMAR